MRTILAIIFMTFATQASAQTKVSTLDEIEKAAVLDGFCSEVNNLSHQKDNEGNRLSQKFEFKNLFDITLLLNDIIASNEYHREKYGPGHIARISNDDRKDLIKRIVLEDFVLTQEVIDNCISDGNKVLSDQYIDHFDYMN